MHKKKVLLNKYHIYNIGFFFCLNQIMLTPTDKRVFKYSHAISSHLPLWSQVVCHTSFVLHYHKCRHPKSLKRTRNGSFSPKAFIFYFIFCVLFLVYQESLNIFIQLLYFYILPSGELSSLWINDRSVTISCSWDLP